MALLVEAVVELPPVENKKPLDPQIVAEHILEVHGRIVRHQGRLMVFGAVNLANSLGREVDRRPLERFYKDNISDMVPLFRTSQIKEWALPRRVLEMTDRQSFFESELKRVLDIDIGVGEKFARGEVGLSGNRLCMSELIKAEIGNIVDLEPKLSGL